MEINLPNEFQERYMPILGDDNKAFLDTCKTPARKSIRINTLKISIEECLEKLSKYKWKIEKIPFIENGFWIDVEAKGRLGQTLEHFLGYYYVQEAASMIPALVLDPRSDEFILDMAAAPGSKTTQIAEIMENKGALLANDVSHERIKALKFNLERCGVLNCAISEMDARRLANSGVKFDKILLDAPCSGEATIIKDPKVAVRWSEHLIRKMSKMQKQLIASAVQILNPGGTLVYSVCTFAPEECEEVIDFAIRKFGVEVVKTEVNGIEIKPGITEWKNKTYDESVKNCIRIWPHETGTCGFFVAKLKRSE